MKIPLTLPQCTISSPTASPFLLLLPASRAAVLSLLLLLLIAGSRLSAALVSSLDAECGYVQRRLALPVVGLRCCCRCWTLL